MNINYENVTGWPTGGIAAIYDYIHLAGSWPNYQIWSEGSPLSCLDNLMNSAISQCQAIQGQYSAFDDCIVGGFFGGNPYYYKNDPSFQRPQLDVIARTCNCSVPWHIVPAVGGRCGPGCTMPDGTIYFRRDCTTTSNPGNLEVCEELDLNWAASPISLLWTRDADIEQSVTLTSFPLEPRASGRWYEWKASAKTPLLVFDPAHRGEIHSAAQLFGNWSFGGRRSDYAPARLESSTPSSDLSWETGYQALALFDRDADGKLSGAELAPLGLWFDDNQDGVSQPGEVKRLEELQVTTLYYSPDRVDSATGSIFASLGFERIVDGRVYRGGSVDWFGKAASSKADAVKSRFMRTVLCAQSRGNEPLSEAQGYAGEPEPGVSKGENTAAAKSLVELKGAWAWWIDHEGRSRNQRHPDGYFMFRETAGNAFEGLSMIEKDFKRGAALRGLAKLYGFQGRVSKDREGRPTIGFTMPQASGPLVKSSARLSPQGALLGTTTLSARSAGKDPASFSYTWRAEKLR